MFNTPKYQDSEGLFNSPLDLNRAIVVVPRIPFLDLVAAVVMYSW